MWWKVHSSFKVRPRRGESLAVSKVLNCPPAASEAVGWYLQASAALCWPSGDCAVHREDAESTCKTESPLGRVLLCLLLWLELEAYTIYYFVWHLAEQTLTVCEMHGFVPADGFHSSVHPGTERTPAWGPSRHRNFPNLCVLSRKEKVLFISHFLKFISLEHWWEQ